MERARLLPLAALTLLALPACETATIPEPTPTMFPAVTVQVAYDTDEAAFRFTWRSERKTLPTGFANVGQTYPMQFHDILRYRDAKFDRLPAGQRLDEDRISFMLQNPAAVPEFNNAGCWVACHSGMASHRLLAPGVLDHWHWRGGRSGPMGYAEDAALNEVERIRDNTGTPGSKWIRSGGDRLREDQAALAGTGHPTAEGMPRFVFNRGKAMPGYTVPSFFLTNADNDVMEDPYTEIPLITTVDVNRSLMVIYQDLTFDPVDKVNALDVGYLVYVALGTTGHLPTHLRDTTTADFAAWRTYWAQQLGAAATDASAAEATLAAITAEWEGADRNAMVTRSVSAIYASDQHDVSSIRAFDPVTSAWTVTMYRKLATGSNRDADLSGLPTGQRYIIGFAAHDVGGGSETHRISLPYTVGTPDDVDIPATAVADVRSADWSAVPAFGTNFVRDQYKWRLDQLRGPAHPGAASVGTVRCQSCHDSSDRIAKLNP